jgi:competence ComEA-like helix-hairpin-helix protein
VATPNEQKALLYFALVALLGAGVQLREASKAPRRTPAEERELRNQLLAAERAARAAERKGAAPKGKTSRAKSSRGAGKGTADGAAAPPPGASPPPAAASRPAAPPFPIDVDRATAADLQRLPGIGPALAGRIVANRDSFGAFGSIEALDEVKGIGPAMIGKIGPLVTFSGPRRPVSDRPPRRGKGNARSPGTRRTLSGTSR